ncbi:MAG: helix-turn-helix domain-containing protein [Xanthobacteraceae bacterium]
MRVRRKADGRIVEILADGSERALPVSGDPQGVAVQAKSPGPGRNGRARDPAADIAHYSRTLRGRTKLTQAEFAARIGVPIETVRNWEQGKRSPRGPARALLKIIDKAPELAFAALADDS